MARAAIPSIEVVAEFITNWPIMNQIMITTMSEKKEEFSLEKIVVVFKPYSLWTLQMLLSIQR
jgi:hypothetical protein